MCRETILSKCERLGVHDHALQFIAAYLDRRSAQVVVGGCFSDCMELANQVFQGIVLGPKLWNSFFSDIRFVVQRLGLIDLSFADDLNAFQIFASDVPNSEILAKLKSCQADCHSWGATSQVEFEGSKETFIILHKCDSYDLPFKLLGVVFDPLLKMQATLDAIVGWVSAKLRAIFRLRKFYSVRQIATMCKSQILSSI